MKYFTFWLHVSETKINGDEDDADEAEVQLEEPSTTASVNVPPLPIPPPVTQAESPQPEETENEDIIIKKTTNSYEEDLYKKTNEELKKILKDQGKNTKGAKAELIKRIIEEL